MISNTLLEFPRDDGGITFIAQDAQKFLMEWNLVSSNAATLICDFWQYISEPKNILKLTPKEIAYKHYWGTERVETTLLELKILEVIKILKDDIYCNPYLMLAGRNIDQDIFEYFSDTVYWHISKDCIKPELRRLELKRLYSDNSCTR